MTSTPVKGSGVREGFPTSGMGSQAAPELEPGQRRLQVVWEGEHRRSQTEEEIKEARVFLQLPSLHFWQGSAKLACL